MNYVIALALLMPQIIVPNAQPWDGYVDRWGYEVPGLISNDTWMTPLPTYTKGKMVFYGPYAMDATAEYRGIDYKKEGCIGGISLMSPYNIGDKAWIYAQGEWHGPFCVVDCARKGDIYSIVINRGEVAEANFEFAQQLGMVSEHTFGDYEVYKWYKNVEILVNISPELYFAKGNINPEPIDYPEYFKETLEFASGWEPKVILTKDGLWKEYGNNKYWLKRIIPEPLSQYFINEVCQIPKFSNRTN